MIRNYIIALIFIGVSACGSVKNTDSVTEGNTLPDPTTMHYEMQKRGIDFYAKDADNKWQLEIDYQKTVKFSADDLKKDFSVNILTLGNGLKGSEATHVVRNRDAQLTITITTSETPFDVNGGGAYEVNLVYHDFRTSQETEYNGKGKFYGAIQLHDIWKLETINGAGFDTTHLHKHPYMEIHLDNGRVMGFLGCNSFSTSVYFGRDEMTFGMTMSTKMACPRMDIEDKFGSLISNNTLSYRLEGLNLYLENETDTLKFKKVD